MSSPLVYTLPLFMFSDSHTRESDFWIILTNFYVLATWFSIIFLKLSFLPP